MLLRKLELRNFRCFEKASLPLDPDLNWIIGQNASGKTSLLEALFFLGHARSFRSARPDRLIHKDAESFELVARLGDSGRERVLGIGRRDGITEARFAGEKLRSMADAAKMLPVVILDSDMNNLVGGGPGERRRWLDWGVFHVEHAFLPLWREYQQTLRQRNVALKSGGNDKTLAPWTQAVARAGEALAALRDAHFTRLSSCLLSYCRQALPETEVHMQYRAGWPEDETLLEALTRQVQRDREQGNTRAGPHRADIQLKVDGQPAEERLSRGQQKMLAGALWLAQVSVFSEQTKQRPLLLVDDLAAELDGDRLDRFLALLGQQSAQQVLTAIADSDISRTGLTAGQVFHVEHGTLKTG